MHGHERSERPGFYRARDGLIFGVCKGAAHHLAISVFWTRVIAVVILFVSGFWPAIIGYILIALLTKPEPVVPFKQSMDREFYDSYVNSPNLALERLKHTFDRLDGRIRRMESIVTDREYDWERRLRESD